MYIYRAHMNQYHMLYVVQPVLEYTAYTIGYILDYRENIPCIGTMINGGKQ
jgi:hypothetical protein